MVVRFYEAEGNEVHAKLRLFGPIKQAWKTNLIEDEEERLPPASDGSIEFWSTVGNRNSESRDR